MSCPICSRATQKKFTPFCSKRCADADLGNWLTGAYAVPAHSEEDDDDLSDALANEEAKKH